MRRRHPLARSVRSIGEVDLAHGRGVKYYSQAFFQRLLAEALERLLQVGIGEPYRKRFVSAASQTLGADAVLVNTGVAKANEPVTMARAMRSGAEAGRLAYRAGRIPISGYANPSSPVEGVPVATGVLHGDEARVGELVVEPHGKALTAPHTDRRRGIRVAEHPDRRRRLEERYAPRAWT